MHSITILCPFLSPHSRGKSQYFMEGEIYIYIYIYILFLVLFFRASYNDLNEKHQPDAVNKYIFHLCSVCPKHVETEHK